MEGIQSICSTWAKPLSLTPRNHINTAPTSVKPLVVMPMACTTRGGGLRNTMTSSAPRTGRNKVMDTMGSTQIVSF